MTESGREAPDPPASPTPAATTEAANEAATQPANFLPLFILTAALVIILDRWTKALVVRHLPFNHDVPILGEWAMLTHIKNTGGAFGLFPGSTIPLIVISAVASVVLCVMAFRLRGDRLRSFALGLILGGAIGNLVDRIFSRMVTDFINVGIPNGARWPYFNVADSGVTIGVLILGWLVYFRSPSHGDESERRTPESSADAHPDRIG